ncbi:hypothetical protein PoB_001196200 [Plakobranchus ocellatus]|uniref:Uncharacterized protein n=1 Tax=Plakobranchus ocellatus TaxID=259542 RepID=A0AAV3YR98_9GAST|nr:hypothetical protein PoB_001196200 [Plakobranchus ocellatus]
MEMSRPYNSVRQQIDKKEQQIGNRDMDRGREADGQKDGGTVLHDREAQIERWRLETEDYCSGWTQSHSKIVAVWDTFARIRRLRRNPASRYIATNSSYELYFQQAA